jgi:hypothetical protein
MDVLESKPNDFSALVMRGKAYLHCEEIEKAKEDLLNVRFL